MKARDFEDDIETSEALREVKLLRSRTVRLVLVVVGSLCVALGVVGIFVPGLPTTIFILTAAACYARASPRFYNWLLSNPAFGPLVHEWRTHGSMPRRAKVVAITLILTTFGVTLVFFVDNHWIRAALVAVALALVMYLARIPSRDTSL